ncbi:MAG TPA: FtsX-like permease family protein, partial [Vicinamibacterales bacterium]|nr:FtsX-like permease family protein [Vicinamibacterales bacterium]
GRFFENRDWTHGSVIVVSQAMADRFWPDGSAVGRFITTRRGGPRWEVVGVAGDVKYESLRESRAPLMYIPFPRVPKMFSSGMYLTARAGPGGPNPLAVMRQTLRDGQAPPIVGELNLGDALSRAVAPERQSAMVLSAFATLAFVLAIIGVYGLSAFNVARRSRELSVRIAMGATTAGLAGLVLRESLAFVGLGLGLGLAAALVFGQVLSARLYGVPVSDPVTLAAVAIAVMLAAVAATVPPAVRATHVDVATVLRRD